MKVWNVHADKRMPMSSLLAALRLVPEQPVCLSVVGGGGKTTVIGQLAEEYAKYHSLVAVAPATKIRVPQEGQVLEQEDASVLATARGILTIGIPLAENKLGTVSEEFFRQICTQIPVVLMEADGSKGLPAKAPARWEPVIRPETTMVLAVLGLDAIGRPFREICHRPELAAGLLGKQIGDWMTEEDAASLLTHTNGQKKGVMPGMEYRILLNKADNPTRMKIAEILAHKLEERGYTDTIIMRAKEEKDNASVD